MKKETPTSTRKKRDWSQFNGPAFLISVLKAVDPAFRRKLVAGLRAKSQLLAALVDRTEFIYLDLARIEVGSLERFWAAVPESKMAIAWKLTESPLKEHLLKGLSERRKQSFLELCTHQPRMPRQQVVRVQQDVAKQTHALVCSGKLALTSRRFGEKSI